MGITQFFDTFYRDLDPSSYSESPANGQLCWIPVPHLNPIPQVLKANRSIASEHTHADFTIRNAKDSDFSGEPKLPLYHLGLRMNEELLVMRGKRRPGIVILPDNILFDDISRLLRSAGKKHLQQNLVLVIPIYSIQSENRPTGFPSIMVARIKALMYNQFFYFPRTQAGNRSIEGVARLDRIQLVYPQGPIAYNPIPKAVTDEVMAVLVNMFRIWLGIPCDGESIKDYYALKELVLNTLPEGEARITI